MDEKKVEVMFMEHEKLIYFVIERFIQNKDNLGILFSREDLYQIGAMGLVKAIKTYQEDKGAFSTYATNIIRNKILSAIRDYKDVASDNSISVDDENNFIENEAALKYNSYKDVEDNLFTESQKEVLFAIAKTYTGIAKKGVIAIHLNTQGYNYKTIAKMFKTDSKTLSAWVARAREKLKKEPKILELIGKERI